MNPDEHPDEGMLCTCTRCGGTGREPYNCDDESHTDAHVYGRPWEPCGLCPPCPVCVEAECSAVEEAEP